MKNFQVSPFYIIYKKSQDLWFGVYYNTLAPCLFDMGSETDACFGEWHSGGGHPLSTPPIVMLLPPNRILQIISCKFWPRELVIICFRLLDANGLTYCHSLITSSSSPTAPFLPSLKHTPGLSLPSHPLSLPNSNNA